MYGLVLRQLAATVLTGWVILSAIFLLSYSTAAVDVEQLGLSAAGNTERAATSQQLLRARKQVRHRLGLDAPLFYVSVEAAPAAAWLQLPRLHWNGPVNRYHTWVSGLVRGNLGHSYRNGVAVTTLLTTALRHTLPFTIAAGVAAAALAFWLAMQLARSPWWSRGIVTVLVTLDSLPLFLVALLLLLLFANPDGLEWLPAYGIGEADRGPWWQQFPDTVLHLILPVCSLLLVTLPGLTIQLHAALLRELQQQYILTARAKGAGAPRVIRKHALRNALLPSITLLTDMLPALLAGAVVVEVIYALPGTGRLLAEAATARDYPVLLGTLLVITVARLVGYIIADIAYVWADPRLRPVI